MSVISYFRNAKFLRHFVIFLKIILVARLCKVNLNLYFYCIQCLLHYPLTDLNCTEKHNYRAFNLFLVPTEIKS